MLWLFYQSHLLPWNKRYNNTYKIVIVNTVLSRGRGGEGRSDNIILIDYQYQYQYQYCGFGIVWCEPQKSKCSDVEFRLQICSAQCRRRCPAWGRLKYPAIAEIHLSFDWHFHSWKSKRKSFSATNESSNPQCGSLSSPAVGKQSFIPPTVKSFIKVKHSTVGRICHCLNTAGEET